MLYWGITKSNDGDIKSNPSIDVRPMAAIEICVSTGMNTSDEAVTVINEKSSPSVTLPGVTLNLITGSAPDSWAKAEEPAIRVRRPATAKEVRSNLPNTEHLKLVIIRHIQLCTIHGITISFTGYIYSLSPFNISIIYRCYIEGSRFGSLPCLNCQCELRFIHSKIS